MLSIFKWQLNGFCEINLFVKLINVSFLRVGIPKCSEIFNIFSVCGWDTLHLQIVYIIYKNGITYKKQIQLLFCTGKITWNWQVNLKFSNYLFLFYSIVKNCILFTKYQIYLHSNWYKFFENYDEMSKARPIPITLLRFSI